MELTEDERTVSRARRCRRLALRGGGTAAAAAVAAAFAVPLVAGAQEQPAPLPAEDVRVVNQVNEPVPITAQSRPFQRRYPGAAWASGKSCHNVEPPEGTYIVFSRLFARGGQGPITAVVWGDAGHLAFWGPASTIERELLFYALPGDVANEVRMICAISEHPASYATITGRYEALRPE